MAKKKLKFSQDLNLGSLKSSQMLLPTEAQPLEQRIDIETVQQTGWIFLTL